MMAARFGYCTKTKPREVSKPAGLLCSHHTGSGESIERYSSAHLDPLHSSACTSSLGVCSRLLPHTLPGSALLA